MRRLFRRGAKQTQHDGAPDAQSFDDARDVEALNAEEFEPFVPVRRGYETYQPDISRPETIDLEPDAVPEDIAPDVSQQARPRRFGAIVVRWDLLLWVVILVLVGVVGTLLVRGVVSEEVATWLPGVVLAFAVVWMLFALLRRHVTSFLGATALVGVGLSLVMDAQAIARFEETVLGVALVTIGLGVVMRGLFLRQRSPM